MNTHLKFALYTAAVDADRAWQAALVRTYGAEVAGACRYDARGEATAELAALCNAKVSADAAYRQGAFALGRAA